MPQGKTLLIDGDILQYRCAFAAEHTYYLVDGKEYSSAKEYKDAGATGTVWSRKEIKPVEFAFQAVQTTLRSFGSLFNPADIRIYLSSDRTFREDVAKTLKYKGNRDGVAKPKHHKDVREFLLSQGAIVRDGLEADDCLATDLTSMGDSAILLSIDKDLDQVEGQHYNWVTDEFYTINKKGGAQNLFIQILSGDSTDNVPGLPGWGKIKADRLVSAAKSPHELYESVLDAYHKAGKDMDYFMEQANLVYILRSEGDSFAKAYPYG